MTVKLLSAMLCLGAFAAIAQVLFVRETLVVFFGNELSIGVMFASWLLGISLGAFAARFLQHALSSAAVRQRVLTALLLIVAVALPLQIVAVRIVRLILHVPPGEYASLAAIFAGSLLIFLPTSFSVGLFFPLACRAYQERAGGGAAATVSRVYMIESVGSMVGGAALTYWLLPAMTAFRIVLLASTLGLAAAALMAAGRKLRIVLAALAVCLAALVSVYPRWLAGVERRTVEARWRAFGALQPATSGGSPEVRLAAETDTIYQNLAITESAGQYVLYADGRVMSQFPDPGAYEHSVHFVMAQNPGAKRVLLLGGNPVGDIPELLKYKLERLVYVELDPGVGRLIQAVQPALYDAVLENRLPIIVSEDAPRYVRRCRESFDVILVNAPEPTTAGANRYYTLEFYRDLRRILAPSGFVYTAVGSSERLQSEAADLGASVYQTLKRVFPVVRVTAETRNRFFAGSEEAGIGFSRKLLTARSEAAAIPTRFFKPAYFVMADEIDDEKTLEVERIFAARRVPLNTNMRPATYFYNLLLWSRFSGSGVESFLGALRSLDGIVMVKWLLAIGLVCLFVGVVLRGFRQGRLRSEGGLVLRLVPPKSPDEGGNLGEGGLVLRSPDALRDRDVGGWSRAMLGLILLTTGLCGMALEIVLIFVFQGLYGYVYTRMGLIMAAFMLGLVLGAPSGRLMAAGKRSWAWLALAGVEVALLACALGIPKLAGLSVSPDPTGRALAGFEILIYVAVIVVGWGVGAEFPLANRLYCDAGGALGAAAAITDAADHLGAAAGALLVGVVLVPVLGMAAACAVLAALKLAGLLFIASAILTMPGPISASRWSSSCS